MKNLGIVLTSTGGARSLWIGFEIITDMTGDLVRYRCKQLLGAGDLVSGWNCENVAKRNWETIRNSGLE